MILIDKPFASDFLIQTIKENNYEVVSTEDARALIEDEELSWIPEKEACKFIRENPEAPLYTNSENVFESYAESLMMNGDLEPSLKNYQKAIDIALKNEDRDIDVYKRNLEIVKSKIKANK